MGPFRMQDARIRASRRLRFSRSALVFGTVVGAAAWALQGCAAEVAPDSDEFSMTTTLLTEQRLAASATEAGAEVRIELMRGAPRTTWVGGFEKDGMFEGDSLVVDGRGYAFLSAFGGDKAVDPTWFERLHVEQVDVDPIQRQHDLALAAKAADILAADPRVDIELRRLAGDVGFSARTALEDWIANGAPDGDSTIHNIDEQGREMPSETKTTIPSGSDSTVGVTTQALAAPTYVHQVYIRRGNCCVALGEHSSILLKIWNNAGTLLNTIATNNHGRRADDASLSNAVGCPKSFSGRTSQIPNFQPYKATDRAWAPNGINAGGCGTPYDAVFPTAGGHACNDDSLAMYLNVKNNSWRNWGTCSDASLKVDAPTCN